jgi:hypothetical protein
MAQTPPKNDPVTVRYVPSRQPARKSILRRPGCVIALVIWFVLLLTIPYFIFTMVTSGEISLTTGGAPDQRARLWLISNPRERGFGFSNTWVASEGENRLCMQTDVQYWLWQGSQAPSVYCECYTGGAAAWSFTSATQAACSAPSDG